MSRARLAIIFVLILLTGLLQSAAESQKSPVEEAIQKVAPLPKSTLQSQFVANCVQDIMKRSPMADKKEAHKRCIFRDFKTKPMSARINEIGEMSAEQFIEVQQGKMLLAADRCATEQCKADFRKEYEMLAFLNTELQMKLKEIGGRKLDKTKKFTDLKKSMQFIKYNPALEFKARTIDGIQLEISRKGFIEAEQKFISAKERARITKQQFDKAREAAAACGTNETPAKSAECRETADMLNTKSKEHLLNTADRIFEHLSKLKGKIESSEDITEEEASEIVMTVDEQIGIIQQEREKIEKAETKEGIIQSAKRLRVVWAKIKQATNPEIQKTVNARIGGIIVRLSQLGVKLERILEKVTERNIDVSDVEPLVEEFDKKVEAARINYEKAQEKFEEKLTVPDASSVKEAQEYMKKAHGALQDAQKELKYIILSINHLEGASEIGDAENESIEEELDG